MGISLRRAARAAPADPAAGRDVGLYLSARRRVGAGRRRAGARRPDRPARRPRPGPGRVPARAAGRPAGDGLRRRPVRLGRQRGSRGRARVPARDPRRDPRGRRRRHRRVRQGGARRAAARRTSREIDRIASTPVRSATDIGAALRLATALFPDDAQKRIVLLSDGNDTTGGGQAEAALAATRDIRIETRLIGLGGADEVLVERLTTPSTASLGESIEAIAEIRSSVAQPATVRLFADGELVGDRAGRARGRRHPGGVRRDARARPASTPSGWSSRPPATRSARTTGPTRTRSSRASRGRSCWPATRPSPTELVGALETQRQQVDTIVPEALPTDFGALATYDSVVLVDVPRIRLVRPPARGAAGLRPRPRARAW